MQILATLGFLLVVFTRDLKDYGFFQELCEVDNFRFKKTSAFLCKKDYVMDIIQVRS